MPDCIFCQIVAGEKSCYKIFENNLYLAFLDINPKVTGHTLIIPKLHYLYIWDLPNPGELLNIAQILVRRYKPILKTDLFFTSTWGRIVPHAHLHLLPQNVTLSLSLSEAQRLLSTT